jgi:glycosyltransferase involved in cell wall biosynthesis
MISVVVCTYNRAESLQRTLHSLHDMATPASLEWELVVVDNNSRDRTRDVVAAFARNATMPTRYLFEGRQGLSCARNTGVRAARGDVIAFTDDDCLVDPQWLARIDAEFRTDASLAVVGGRVELHDPRDQPVSVRIHRERVPVKSLQEIATFMIGCNMSCRRRLFDDVGYFDVRFGSGAKIPSAEDWDFVYRSYKAGAKIVFSPDVLVFHDHGRRSDVQVESLRRGYAIGRWAFYCKHAASFDVEVARTAAHDFTRLAEDLVRARRQPRTLVPVALGVTYWLQAVVRRGLTGVP